MQINSKEWKNLVQSSAKKFEINLDDDTLELFSIHAENLVKWNKKINLTAITDPVQIALKHYVDSIFIINIIPNNGTVLDIGSGGGFPGIPAKILLPNVEFTLIDAVRKKINFIKDSIRLLNLNKISAYHIRAEEFKASNYFDDLFDVVCCRAFSSLEECIKMALPLLKEDGKLVAMKGKDGNKEIKKIQNCKISLTDGTNIHTNQLNIELLNYDLPKIHSKRSIIQIRKI